MSKKEDSPPEQWHRAVGWAWWWEEGRRKKDKSLKNIFFCFISVFPGPTVFWHVKNNAGETRAKWCLRTCQSGERSGLFAGIRLFAHLSLQLMPTLCVWLIDEAAWFTRAYKKLAGEETLKVTLTGQRLYETLKTRISSQNFPHGLISVFK